ncbi:Spy/CpxP family protein refolding chaperone [Piscinibacter sp.]|uniref:Spy/CpxP family protein refolding chaperone n=1 Tax=Piscinibacter sp. TaxID=1903157 RepID=UPI002F404B36
MTDATMTSSRAAAGQRALRWLVAGVLLAVSATVAVSAWAQHGPGGPGHHGMGGHGMFMGSPEHMGRMVDHMLDGLNATDAQRAQVKQIAQAAAADLKGQREAGRALREKSLQLFSAPTVDAAAAESVRQQMLAQHDTASRRMLQAMLDISRVLTPEQRAKIGEQMKQRSEMMRERMQRMEREQPKQ